MSRRLRWFLVCLPLLLAAGVSFAVGYQPNFLRNLIGPITITGDLSVTDDLTVTDQLTVSGYTAGRDAGFHNFSLTGELSVAGYTGIQDAGANNVVASGTVSAARVEFLGGGTPGLERGGNTTVQTSSGDGFASLSAFQAQSTADVWDSLRNSANGAACSSNTGAVCINDTGGVAVADGAGTTVAVITAAGVISGDTGVSSGAFAVSWVGGAAVPEGSNGQGAWKPTTVGRGSKVGQVCCSCRVAGSGGTEGIFVSLMETGVEVASVEIAGGDTNACDDAAGTTLCGNLATTVVAAATYTGQFKATTDCAGNPTDCLCNFDVTR